MAYSADIDALSPDHRWAFDGASGTDSVGSATATLANMSSSTAICEDVSNCALSNAISGDRIELGTVTTIGNAAHSRKAMGGWFAVSKVNAHPVRIYGEGDADPTFQFVMAMGNNLMLETVDGGTSVQVYGLALAVDRPYHLYGELQGDGYNDTLRLYVDGVLQQSIAFGSTTLAIRGAAVFADDTGTVGVGGDTVLLQAPVNGSYNQWASWADKALPDATEVREELFEKGATPTNTISSDTLANMQTALNAISGTHINAPLCIRIEEPAADFLFEDSFTDTDAVYLENHTPDTGTGWTRSVGSAGAGAIDTNKLQLQAASATVYMSDDAETADHYSEVTQSLVSNNLFNQAYMCVRLVDSDNFIGYRQTTWENYELVNMVAGSPTSLITGTVVAGDTVRLEASGTTIKLFINDSQEGTDQVVTDHQTETRQGFMINDSTTNAPWDDYEAGTFAASQATNLTLTNHTFPPEASIHIQYVGTDTLTITNVNSNASIGSATSSGSIVFVETVDLSVTCLDASTKLPIENARVYLLDSNDVVLINSLTNSSGIATGTYGYSGDDVISSKSKARKSSSSTYYKTAPITGTINSNGFTTTILMLGDE